MLTAHELFINWARGELELGEDPRPIALGSCSSAERYYRAPGVYEREDNPPPPVCWTSHDLVNRYYKAQGLINRLILVAEYIEQRYTGTTSERQQQRARKIRIDVSDYRYRLYRMRQQVEGLK